MSSDSGVFFIDTAHSPAELLIDNIVLDGDDNLYVAGEEIDFTTNMYKYDPTGAFLFDFRTAGWGLIDVYNDVEVTPDDLRLRKRVLSASFRKSHMK